MVEITECMKLVEEFRALVGKGLLSTLSDGDCPRAQFQILPSASPFSHSFQSISYDKEVQQVMRIRWALSSHKVHRRASVGDTFGDSPLSVSIPRQIKEEMS